MMLLPVALLATTAFAQCDNDAETDANIRDILAGEGFNDCQELITYFLGSCATDLGDGSGVVKRCSPFCIGTAGDLEKGCCGSEEKFPVGTKVAQICKMDCGGCSPTPSPTDYLECACTGDNSLIPETYPDFNGTGYGLFCNAWDLQHNYCDVDSEFYLPDKGNGKEETPPDFTPSNNWCSQDWCYVQYGCSVGDRDWETADPPKVVGKESQTVVFKDPITGKPVDLFYSYEHCGEFSAQDVVWPDFTGCEVSSNPIDVFVVMDGSSSINDDEWANQLYFLKQLITETIPKDEDRFGLVQFSGKPARLERQLDSNKHLYLENLRDLDQMKGGTKTDWGLLKFLDAVDDESLWDFPFDEENRQRVMVLLTDGVPQPPENNPCRPENVAQNAIPERIENGDWVSVIIAIGFDEANRGLLACLVENKITNIVAIDDFDSFDQWRDPTGDLGLLCADPENLQRSKAPTRAPTGFPSVHPTKEPTDFPSVVPTKTPTGNPSPSPTKTPTENPSRTPTKSPTMNPSKDPTATPTEMPSRTPTRSPSKTPSEVPSPSPSATPTESPSGSPTRTPSEMPSDMPSEMPSRSPTMSPTEKPSGDPTAMPSSMPTRIPSSKPTDGPSSKPTDSPSFSPTDLPSVKPTEGPSFMPTDLPSMKPTEGPSFMPSDLPSMKPTSQPSPMPSAEPTLEPTSTDRPTDRPSPPPSEEPTEAPVECPAYENPRPPILPCDEKEECKQEQMAKRKECRRKKTRKRCNACNGCTWNADKESCGAERIECETCQDSPSNPVVKNNMPWGGTQSPDYWYNCIMHFCQKYTWMGGIDQCEYDPKYGCACESMSEEDCVANDECCWSGDETGCQEKVECPRLTFDECLENSDKCAPCGNCGRCGYKCEMGPTQPPLPGFQSLILDEDCNCKVVQAF